MRDQFEIFIKNLYGKLLTMRFWDGDLVQCFKDKIQEELGIPPNLQILVYTRNSMKECTKLQDYDIECDSTIFLKQRLRGGCPGSNNTEDPISFKDAVKGRDDSHKIQITSFILLALYCGSNE